MQQSRPDDQSHLPLHGVKVIDFSRLLPGPWCTQLLGDMGADVIKVERPGDGDPSRHNPPTFHGESVYFTNVNMNKRSVALDLKSKDGRATALRLIKDADVVVESFRAGNTKSLGIDWDSAHALNPGLIYCSITGFGQSGPLSHIAGHDLAIQAMSGILGHVPHAMPTFQSADYAAGAVAAIGILGALRKRDKTGRGCYIDLGMLDSLVSMSAMAMTSALSRASGESGEPALEVWGRNPRYAIYPTRDKKHVAVALLEAEVWGRFCRKIGREDLIDESETPSDRVSNHGAKGLVYREVLSALCASRDRDDLTDEMMKDGLPIVPILSPDEAVAHANMKARTLIGTVSVAGKDAVVMSPPLQGSGLTRKLRRPVGAVDSGAKHLAAEDVRS
jgi:CoA:oxalate CoA-transferase